jgi:hypothetical protein
MTDKPAQGSDPSLAFEHVRDLGRPPHPKAPAKPVAEHAAANLAFEASPRTPAPPAPARSMSAPGVIDFGRTAPRVDADRVAPKLEPGHVAPRFEPVPVSVGPPQARLSTATVGFRPEAPTAPAKVSGPGGTGWNIRHQEIRHAFRADGSAWDIPTAPHRPVTSRRPLLVVLVAVAVVAVVSFAAFKLMSGSGRPTVRIATPASVAGLTLINTPATVAVTHEMEKVMLAYGATHVVSGVYGLGGRPALVVLLAQGPSIETTSQQFFTDLANGLQASGMTVDRSTTISATSGGTQFVCSLATRAASLTPVSLCGWDDGTTIGLVMDVSGQPVSTTMHEAQAARSAGES